MYINKIIRIPKGTPLFSQGETANYCYLTLGGHIGIWINNQKIAEVGKKHILGLEGLYHPQNIYPYSAIPESECRLSQYDSAQLPDQFLSNENLNKTVFSSLSKQLAKCWSLLSLPNQTEPAHFFAGDVISIAPGETIIKEGDNSQEIYRIIFTEQGLEVSKQGKILTLLTETGDFFGEMASILKQPRSATVKSLGFSMLEVYNGDLIYKILQDYPDLSLRIIKDLSKRLAQTSDQFVQV